MDLCPSFVTDCQSTVVTQPGQCALYDPPVTTQPLARVDDASRYTRLYAPLKKELPTARIIVSFVGVQLLGALPRPSLRPSDGLDAVDQFLKHFRVVDLGTG